MSDITPTEAGLVLYRHAQLMLKQIEQAQVDIKQSSNPSLGASPSGSQPTRASSALSLPLLERDESSASADHLHINDSFGHILSELVMTGKMDMALIYAVRIQ